MLDVNCTIFSAVVDQAMTSAAAHPRWLAAINRAVVEVLSNPFMERNPDHAGLIIGSPSGKCYAANGICQCTAFKYGQPCWHRAASRLVRLHDERQVELTATTIAATLERSGIAPDDATRARWAQAQREMDECFV